MIPAVWAPNAQRVTLHYGLDSPDLVTTEPMDIDEQRPGSGWWIAETELPPGAHYAFAVDDHPPRPDPRSLLQPHGPHGPSQVVDLRSFSWTDQVWTGSDRSGDSPRDRSNGRDVLGSVLYELHIGTFTAEGTFDAAIQRLDHLAQLGVDFVELMPVAEFPGDRGWGYDGVNLFAVHHAYGGPHALARFVDAAHRAGIGVVLDVVYNHLGPSGNYLDTFGPYLTEAHETPWGRAVNLDQPGSVEVRRWICDNALMWLRDFHIDALRLDAVHALVDDSAEHLLAQLSRETDTLATELGRPLSLIAESDLNDAAMVTPVDQGGLGMTAQWADDVHHAIHAWLTGEQQGYYVDFGSERDLAKVLTSVFRHDGVFSTFRGKVWGAPVPPGIDGHRFVISTSNHDQVGNRALGDRPGARLSPGMLAISAAILLTAPFTPMLFMGEEWNAGTDWRFFTEHAEPELAEAIRVGRQREFGGHGWTELYGHVFEVPNPQDRSTRDVSVLKWTETSEPEHRRMLEWFRALIALRRAHPDLSSGNLAETAVVSHSAGGHEPGAVGAPAPVVIRRGSCAVLVNPTQDPVMFAIPSDYVVLESWDPVQTGLGELTVDGPGVAIIGPERGQRVTEPGSDRPLP